MERFEPPDGGYGWVVVASAWFILLSMSGTNNVFGLLYPHLLTTFQAGDVHTVAIITAMWFCMFAVCIFGGSLCDAFGCRVVSLAGVIIMALGLVWAAFAPDFATLFCSYGLLCGIGNGLSYMGLSVSIQLYFTTKRSIALGVANSGIGLGTFIYAPLARYLLDEFGWRGTVLLLAGLWLHSLIAAMLLRPLPGPNLPAPPSPLPEELGGKGETAAYLNSSLPALAAVSYSSQINQLGLSYRSLNSDRLRVSHKNLAASEISLNGGRNGIVVASENITEIGGNALTTVSEKNPDVTKNGLTAISDKSSDIRPTGNGLTEISVKAAEVTRNGDVEASDDNLHPSTPHGIKTMQNSITLDSPNHSDITHGITFTDTNTILTAPNDTCPQELNMDNSNGMTVTLSTPNDTSPPDHIPSILKHSQHSLHSSSVSIPSLKDKYTKRTQTIHSPSTPMAERYEDSLCSTVCKTFRNMMDLKAFGNVYVILFVVVQLFTAAFPMLPVYLPRKVLHDGLDTGQAATLISLSGLADTAGRIIFGILGYKLDFTVIYMVCLAATGASLIVVAFTTNFWVIMVTVLLGYVAFAGFALMAAATIVEFVGVEKFARVYGFVLFGTGLGFVMAGPFVAQIFTWSGSYTVVFVVCGCMQLTGAALVAVILTLKAMRCAAVYNAEPQIVMDVKA